MSGRRGKRVTDDVPLRFRVIRQRREKTKCRGESRENREEKSGRADERNYVLSLVARISFVTLAAPLSYGARSPGYDVGRRERR